MIRIWGAEMNLVMLDCSIIKSAGRDLYSSKPQNFFPALEFFLYDGRGVDDGIPFSFTAICNRLNLNPDRVAKSFWDRLNNERQELCRDYLNGLDISPRLKGIRFKKALKKPLKKRWAKTMASVRVNVSESTLKLGSKLIELRPNSHM